MIDKEYIRGVPCPKCGARPGEHCRKSKKNPAKRKASHFKRMQKAQALFNGLKDEKK